MLSFLEKFTGVCITKQEYLYKRQFSHEKCLTFE